MLRRFAIAAVSLLAATAALDLIFPPPIEKAQQASPLVLDREGRWLHAFATVEGRWRFAADLDEVDPVFIERLVLVEDKRFWRHGGVDPLAIARAAGDALTAGRITSGASTITMQTARLLEPRPRHLGSKLIEMIRAAQLERRLTKSEILELYLTLAPYGGNIEGVRAASLVYFGKEPARLTDAEQALLIALPQAPEARRPDRRVEAAVVARGAVLEKLVAIGALDPGLAAEADATPAPQHRLPRPKAAYHAARELALKGANRSTIDLVLQREVEFLASAAAREAEDGATAAVLVVRNDSRAVLAAVGSSGLDAPGGWIDMTRAVRSPGSALKPFIYALAMEDGLISPATVIEDMPQSFGGYSPENFDRMFHGDVSVAEALQHSLNLPAVRVLERIGAERLASLLRVAGVDLSHKDSAGGRTGLTLALGGAGVTMRDLGALYAALGDGGRVLPLAWTDEEAAANSSAESAFRLFSAETALKVSAILGESPALAGRAPGALAADAPVIAMKTGTSYGYRDAWAAGHAGGYTVVAWIGRADGAARAGQTGREAAAPLLASVFDLIWRHDANAGVGARQSEAWQETPLARIEPSRRSSPPEIVFPRDGVEILVDGFDAEARGVALAARGGGGAYRWYVGGEPVAADALGARSVWRPAAPGFYDIVVVDAAGRASSAKVRVSRG